MNPVNRSPDTKLATRLLGLAILVAAVATLAAATTTAESVGPPTGGHTSEGCIYYGSGPGGPAPTTLVVGTVSHFGFYTNPYDPWDPGHCPGGPGQDRVGFPWASHAQGCLDASEIVPQAVGPAVPVPALPPVQHGVYCGPEVPAGGTVHCSWNIVRTDLDETWIVAGWDMFPRDGAIWMGEGLALGGNVPGDYAFTNPFGAPSRILVFPTGGPMYGGHERQDPMALHEIGCELV